MLVWCEKCNRMYDDVDRWTICPHTPLSYPVDDLCPKCDTIKTIHGPCKHQKEAMSDNPQRNEEVIVTLDNYTYLAMRTKCCQETAMSRINIDVKKVQLLHCVIGMMGELGELAGAIERHIWYGKDFDAVNFAEELGDTAWYMAEGVEAIAGNLVEILTKNINKLRVRFPDKYTDYHAAEENRNRTAERTILEQDCCDRVQTGQGWAEPLDDSVKVPVVNIDKVPVSFGDGLVRKDARLDSSYDRLCLACNRNPVHRMNTCCICPTCYGTLPTCPKCERRYTNIVDGVPNQVCNCSQ